MEKTIINETILPDDPRRALIELAEFIDSAELDENHHYPSGSNKCAFTGYWQSIDFFYALKEYAHEARRVAGYSST